MHSSRMRTTRLLTISQHALLGVPACLGGGHHVTYPIMHLMLAVCCLHTETHQQCTCLYTAAWSCDL